MWLSVASLNLALAVALGAFGAHGLKSRLDEQGLGWWHTATQYWFWTALGLLVLGVLQRVLPQLAIQGAAWSLQVGIVIFAGSLYLMCLGGPRWLGAITPVGGTLLIVGCGDVGLRVAKLLRGRWRLIAITSSPGRCAELRAAGLVPLVADLDQPATLQRAAGLADAVLHLAPPPLQGQTDPRTAHLLQALARRGGVQRIVYGSTSGVYGDCGGDFIDETRAVAPATDRARRRVRRAQITDEELRHEPKEPIADPEQLTWVERERALVHQALARLSPAQRETLEVAFFEGLSYPEIAQRHNVALGTVKSRAARALATLRAALDGTLDADQGPPSDD